MPIKWIVAVVVVCILLVELLVHTYPAVYLISVLGILGNYVNKTNLLERLNKRKSLVLLAQVAVGAVTVSSYAFITEDWALAASEAVSTTGYAGMDLWFNISCIGATLFTFAYLSHKAINYIGNRFK